MWGKSWQNTFVLAGVSVGAAGLAWYLLAKRKAKAKAEMRDCLKKAIAKECMDEIYELFKKMVARENRHLFQEAGLTKMAENEWRRLSKCKLSCFKHDHEEWLAIIKEYRIDREMSFTLASSPEIGLDGTPILEMATWVLEAAGGRPAIAGDEHDIFHKYLMDPAKMDELIQGWRIAWMGKLETMLRYEPGKSFQLFALRGGPETEWERKYLQEQFQQVHKDKNIEVVFFENIAQLISHMDTIPLELNEAKQWLADVCRIDVKNKPVALAIKEIANHAQQLKTIDLRRTSVMKHGLRELATNCPELQTIYLTSTNVTDSDLREIAHCTKLEDIDLGETTTTDVGIKEIAQYCRNLQTVSLAYTHVTDAGIKELGRHCPQIKKIILQKARVTDSAMEDLARGCPHLNYIDIAETIVTDAGIKEIASNAPELETLELSGTQLTDKGMKEIAQRCPKLRKINLNMCIGVTDIGVKELVRERVLSWQTWQTKPGYILEKLREERMTIQRAKSKCQELSGCIGFYHLGGQDISEEQPIDITFGISSTVSQGLRTYTSHLPKEIVQRCPKLDIILLGGCVHITEIGVKALLSDCKQMKKVVVPRGLDPQIPQLKKQYPGVDIQ